MGVWPFLIGAVVVNEWYSGVIMSVDPDQQVKVKWQSPYRHNYSYLGLRQGPLDAQQVLCIAATHRDCLVVANQAELDAAAQAEAASDSTGERCGQIGCGAAAARGAQVHTRQRPVDGA